MSKRVRLSGGVAVVLLVVGVLVGSSSSPAAANAVGPSGIYNFYAPNWASGYGDYQLSAAPIDIGGTLYPYPVVQSRAHYQGNATDPTHYPTVGNRFYLHFQLELASGLVPNDQADFDTFVVLPPNLVPGSTATPSSPYFPYANDDVVCGTTNENFVELSPGTLPPWCSDPTLDQTGALKFHMSLRGGQIGHYFFPVKALSSPVGIVRVVSYQRSNVINQSPNPVETDLSPLVQASAAGSPPPSTLPPATVPSAPTAVNADVQSGASKITWGPVLSNGGAAITDYSAYLFQTATGGSAIRSCSGGTGYSCTLTGLTNSLTYYVEVHARNSVGLGPGSSPRTPVHPTAPPAPPPPPGAPGAPSTVGADGSAFVSWTPPSPSAGVTGYRVNTYYAQGDASPVSTCLTNGTLSCTVPSLANGHFYFFGVQAKNGAGYGTESTRTAAFTHVPSSDGGVYGPLTPYRLLDTRAAGGCVQGGTSRALLVSGDFGVPATASSVQLNVTVTAPTAGGYLTAYPVGATRPTASNLNFVAGQTVANAVSVAVGNGGQVNLYVNAGCAHVVVDLVGYHTGSSVAAGGFVAVNPVRQVDTRAAGQGPCLAPGQQRDVVVTTGLFGPGLHLLPATVTLNVTVTGALGGGYLTVFPSGTSAPTASNLNYVAGQTVANQVRVRLGPGDKVSFVSNSGCPHVVVDTLGYTVSGTPVRGAFNPVTPARVVDTRASGGCIPNGASRDITVAGVAGLPASPESAWLNVTAVPTSGGGYLTVWPAGATRPTASTLNFGAGQVVPNLTPVAVGAGGKISVYSFGGCTHVVVDAVGYTNPVLFAV